MNYKRASLIIVAVSTLVLTACSQAPAPASNPPSMEPSSQDEVTSSGSIDSDLETIENEIDSLDASTDFPELSIDDLTDLE
jgi:PBP1b-binding outer membrane lipoprotein LpoB